MLRPLYGLNLPYNTACTPSREASDPNAVFVAGQFVKLVNGKAVLAATPADGPGSEIVFEQNNKNWQGVVPTISGLLEAETDQYVTASNIVDRSPLVTRNGVLDLADVAALGTGHTENEVAYVIGFAIGAPVGGVLRYKRYVA